MDGRVAAVLLMLVVTGPSVLAIHTVRRMEADNAPRVIRSAGRVWRTPGRRRRAVCQEDGAEVTAGWRR